LKKEKNHVEDVMFVKERASPRKADEPMDSMLKEELNEKRRGCHVS
jgi:hypothetical protein